mmetsp:Transcript_24757/g.52755  ORF Transcript_24757/g.52755 Transcript_24757/m.52755 type:complete len:574 (+) Transcript_24757:171-1892(+)
MAPTPSTTTNRRRKLSTCSSLLLILLAFATFALLTTALFARNAATFWGLFGRYHRERTLTVLMNFFERLGRPADPTALAFAATYCKSREEVVLEEEGNATGLEQINVVYSTDQAVLPGLLLSMLSVTRSAEDPSAYAFHIVVGDEDFEEAEKVLKCFWREVSDMPNLPTVQLHRARPLGFNRSLLSSDWLRRDNRFDRPAVFARLYLHLYLPNARRAIYLDTDTVVTTDLGQLYRMRLRNAVAASYEIPALYEECYKKYPDIPRGDRSWAFNSGVLLFDLTRWSKIVPKVEHALTLTQGCWSDQLALNIGVAGLWDPLPWAWHVKWVGSPWFSALQEPCLAKGHIFHWTSGDHTAKPWMAGRNKAMDPLVRRFAPCEACSVSLGELPSMCGRRKNQKSMSNISLAAAAELFANNNNNSSSNDNDGPSNISTVASPDFDAFDALGHRREPSNMTITRTTMDLPTAVGVRSSDVLDFAAGPVGLDVDEIAGPIVFWEVLTEKAVGPVEVLGVMGDWNASESELGTWRFGTFDVREGEGITANSSSFRESSEMKEICCSSSNRSGLPQDSRWRMDS